MEITPIGLDLAKSVFQVHAVDAAGAIIVRKALRRYCRYPHWRTTSRELGIGVRCGAARLAFRAALRVRPSARRAIMLLVEWLLVEWPEGEAEPTRYWLSTLPEDISLAALVDIAKLRWRIERDYQELKSELGLAH